MSSPDAAGAAAATVAAEHAVVYGYGVAGAHLTGAAQKSATEAFTAHRVRRDTLIDRLSASGLAAPPSAAAYALPFPVTDAASAQRLAAVLETQIADSYAALMEATTGDARTEAAQWLADSAVRRAGWGGGVSAFPGRGSTRA